MSENQVMVSVCCLTFNHEKFIRRALEGFVMQKTDFPFEVIVHDDASTDGTAAVIREFEEKYPHIIKPVYQTENQHSKGVKIFNTHVLPRATGRYAALCEGDDYWTDEYKLQKQVDAMEKHPECFMCVHRVKEVYMDETPNGAELPLKPLETGVIDSRRMMELCLEYNFHTSSFFFTMEEYKEYRRNPPEFSRLSTVGDMPCLMYFGQLGSVYYLDDTMSCYRRGVPGSWSVKYKEQTVEKMAAYRRRLFRVYRSFDEFTGQKYHALYAELIASHLAAAVILEKKAVQMLKKENREYFMLLSRAKQVYMLAGMVFPRLMQKHYHSRQVARLAERGL